MKKIVGLYILVSISLRGVSQTGFTKDFGNYSMHPITSGYNINAFNSPENTKGRRYFFDQWVKGKVIATDGKEIGNDKYLFNFDKVTNNLLVTQDKKEVIEVNKESIKEIHLEENGQEYEFEKVDKISTYRFVQVLEKNVKLSLYKTVSTHLEKANYTTNGLTESGNAYDEYIDVPVYVIIYKGDMRTIPLKFGAIKSNLKEESKKVKDFYADHMNDEVDEKYLIHLVEYINQG